MKLWAAVSALLIVNPRESEYHLIEKREIEKREKCFEGLITESLMLQETSGWHRGLRMFWSDVALIKAYRIECAGKSNEFEAMFSDNDSIFKTSRVVLTSRNDGTSNWTEMIYKNLSETDWNDFESDSICQNGAHPIRRLQWIQILFLDRLHIFRNVCRYWFSCLSHEHRSSEELILKSRVLVHKDRCGFSDRPTCSV